MPGNNYINQYIIQQRYEKFIAVLKDGENHSFVINFRLQNSLIQIDSPQFDEEYPSDIIDIILEQALVKDLLTLRHSDIEYAGNIVSTTISDLRSLRNTIHYRKEFKLDITDISKKLSELANFKENKNYSIVINYGRLNNNTLYVEPPKFGEIFSRAIIDEILEKALILECSTLIYEYNVFKSHVVDNTIANMIPLNIVILRELF